MAVAAIVAGSAPGSAQSAPVLNVALTSPAMIPGCILTPKGSGDELEAGPAVGCISTALQPVLADANSKFLAGNFNDGMGPTFQTFTTTFNAWNAAVGGGAWTLVNGGNLDLTFNVTDKAGAHPFLGGIDDFTIKFTKNAGYVGPTIDQLVWSQALYTSYESKPPFNNDVIVNTMDDYANSKGNAGPFSQPCVPIPGQNPGANNNTPADIPASPAGRAYCGPIYPFQYADASFFDAPQSYWPDESFRAIALLSTVTFKTDASGAITERDLTVYNGVDWGFDLKVPEPSAVLLVITSLILLRLLRCRTPWRA